MKAKLIEKRLEALGIYSFFWELEVPVNYHPGQYFYFTLPKLSCPDSRGSTRHFTLSSSPTEDSIRFTTRIREESGFKKTLTGLKDGAEIDCEGPNGTFVLNDKELGPHIFIAGGIGITPFRSMIKYAIDKKLPHKIHLIYSNSIPEEIAFRAELNQWSKTNPNIKVDMTISKPEELNQEWSGLRGRIDENMINKLVPNHLVPIYWLCGPPPMVDAMQGVLGKIKITSAKIRLEKFTGY